MIDKKKFEGKSRLQTNLQHGSLRYFFGKIDLYKFSEGSEALLPFITVLAPIYFDVDMEAAN